jgi:hypothetical protein
MTAAEACTLVADLTLQLSASRTECEAWRLMAGAWMDRAVELQRERDMLDARSTLYRLRTQEVRDVWLDQADLRRAEAA